MEQNREAFEAWARSQGHDVQSAGTNPAVYVHSITWHVWAGWQAATAARDAEVSKLREALKESTEALAECGEELGAGPLTGLGQQISINRKLLKEQQ
jgi:hypothetical protein